MKTLTLAFAALLAAVTLSAANPVDETALKTWATKAMQRCPGATATMDFIDRPGGPSNFRTYRVEQKSSDEHCGSQSFLLFSPVTQQIFFGSVIALPDDQRPLATRLSEHAGKLLKQTITARLSPLTLPDGVRPVALTRETPYGPFAYNGYVDASGKFLFIGILGNLKENPALTLRKALGVDSGAKRGNGVSKTEIIEISDFQCPTCARAHEALEPLVSKSLGRISYIRLDLPLFEHHQWAMSAALGARAIQRVAPAKYWQYVDHVFDNQEKIANLNFDKFLKDFVEDNDIQWKPVEKIYKSASERTALLDQVSRAFAAGVVSTPTIIINGQRMGFGDSAFAIEAMKSALGAPSGAAATTKK